jgi:serine/threonine-protein kinase
LAKSAFTFVNADFALAGIVPFVTFSDPYGLVGQVLDGQFRVDEHIGEGGFSVVYRGTHVGLSEPIAVKCLKLPLALGSALVESFVRRFRDESRIHYKLSQGNLHIVRSIASGTTIAPTTSALVPYTVLEWLEGHSLAHEFNERREAGLRGRPLREVVSLLDSAIEALAYAHAQGVVHRDLNPGNFFLARTTVGTRVKILDFGVAKIMADSAIAMGPIMRTVGNVRMFAPAYGAPEQFDDRFGAIGPWTDVYTIGLVLLEAMADRTVMEGEHLGEFMTKALDTANRPSPRSLGIAVGDETQKMFMHALAVEPARRPRDAGELWGMLKHSMQVDGRSSRPARTVRLDDAIPSTLRIEEREKEAQQGRAGSSPGPAPRAMGGTLRMDPGVPKTASEWLSVTPLPGAVTPLPVRTSTPPPARTSTPPPARTSIPPAPRISSLVPPQAFPRRTSAPPPPLTTPIPPGISAPPIATMLSSGARASMLPVPAVPASTGDRPSVIEVVRAPEASRRPSTAAVLTVGLVILVLAGAAGVGWHVWHTQPSDAVPDTVPTSP